MAEQNNNGCVEYANKYIFKIRHLADMIECKDNAAFVLSLREDFGKLGLFSSAANFLRQRDITKPYQRNGDGSLAYTLLVYCLRL